MKPAPISAILLNALGALCWVLAALTIFQAISQPYPTVSDSTSPVPQMAEFVGQMVGLTSGVSLFMLGTLWIAFGAIITHIDRLRQTIADQAYGVTAD